VKALDPAFERWPWLPYVAPFALFIAFTAVQPSEGFVPWLYPLKTVTVGVLLILGVRGLPPLEPRSTGLAVGVGAVVFALWVLPEGLYPVLSAPRAVDPFEHLPHPQAWAWVGVRIVGASVVVAVMEEMFWRGFLLRWIVEPDFRRVPIGTFTWPSFLAVSVLFAVEHERWLVGLLAGVAYNLLLYRTRSLYACVVAHGVTNFVLAVWVLYTGAWSFW
jgi:hypothetical protein